MNKPLCPACAGTGWVINMGIREECPMCENECDHQYAEQETAPLGVTCIKCGHFTGAWE